MQYRGPHSTERLVDALMDLYSSEELSKLARLTGSRPPTRKAELAEHIARYLAGDGLRKAFDSLNELERAAVSEVVHSDTDTLDRARFHAKYGRHPDDRQRDDYTYCWEMTVLDMILIGTARVLPRELKKRLAVFVPPPVTATVGTSVSPPEHYQLSGSTWAGKADPIAIRLDYTEERAQRELAAVLRLVDGTRVSVGSKTLRPSKAALAAVSTVLDGEDFYSNDEPRSKYRDPNPGPIRAFAWPMILQAAEYLSVSKSRLQLTDEGRAALSLPRGIVLRRLWDRWIHRAHFDELSRIEFVKGQTGKAAKDLTLPLARRRAIEGALASCPEGEWIEVKELDRFMRASGLEVPVTENAWRLYLGHPEYGSLAYGEGPEVLDRTYLKAVLLEYAATLGLIDVALVPPADVSCEFDNLWGMDEFPYFSRYDGLVAFRINPLGAYCLGMRETYASLEADRHLRVLANRDIVATADIPAGDRLALDQYFAPVSDLVWRVEADQLLSVVDSGGTVEEVREYLVAHSETPIPETVNQLLDDIAERSGRLHDAGTGRLVECDDEALASLIASDTLTRKHCMLAGARHLVVPTKSEAAFKRGLRKLGFTVRWTEDERAP